jgi:hypothetical protein
MDGAESAASRHDPVTSKAARPVDRAFVELLIGSERLR